MNRINEARAALARIEEQLIQLYDVYTDECCNEERCIGTKWEPIQADIYSLRTVINALCALQIMLSEGGTK